MARPFSRAALVGCSIVVVIANLAAAQTPARDDLSRLVAALLGDTPMLRDLEFLTDHIGGRATGSAANLRAVDWGVATFQAAGVTAKKESFRMPSKWLERSARATVRGDGIDFSPRVAAMPFSVGTPPSGTTAPLLDVGAGSDSDFARLGTRARGAFVLVEQQELKDIDGLFKEYDESGKIEARAFAAGVAGVVYMGSRPNDLLYRHNVNVGDANTRPMMVMESDGARRALRLLRSGVALTLTESIDVDRAGPYESFNVVGEIRGATRPDEIVLIGSHLDSWDLGDGALDNGANAAMMIDVARQMQRLGLHPARTIRFVLWNGEEQGMIGSQGYAGSHEAELGKFAMTAAFDIGCGKINGFFTNGRAELLPMVERALKPVGGLGPFQNTNAPIVGTDNFDFMLNGVANLVANQEAASYGPNYHARSDTFDKCDPQQLRLNAAVTAAVTWAFANDTPLLARQSRKDVEALMRTTDLAQQMKSMGVWEEWDKGTRGRKP
jgi:hypothetical protein